MPELPDLELYVEAIRARAAGARLTELRLESPFLLRSVSPPIETARGRRLIEVRRLGKRLLLELEGELFLVLHLMIAGRLHWAQAGARLPKRSLLAAFAFETGILYLTEAGSKRRASLHVVEGRSGLLAHDRGGREVSKLDLEAFRSVLAGQRHTLKRTLTDPHVLSGIGNAYSDEILHRARLSPFKLSSSLSPAEAERLYVAARAVLTEWTERLRQQNAGAFPEKVSAFREGMAVHGRYRAPCPTCGAPIQRIVHGEHETNYCAGCQTGGKLLKDRSLSRLLKDDWPKRLEDLERS